MKVTKYPTACPGKYAANSNVGTSVRITLSCPEKGDHAGKLVFLPSTLEQLIDIGVKKFDFTASKILTKDGAEVEEIEIVRDGDHLILVGDDENYSRRQETPD